MKRWIHASDDYTLDDYSLDEERNVEDIYNHAAYDEGFLDIENDVIDELGLYIDFSAVRGTSGPIWIFFDPNHENNSDMWLGDLDDAICSMDFSEYVSDIVYNVIPQPGEKWKELYKEYLKDVIEE